MSFRHHFKRFEKPGESERGELGRLFHYKRRLSFYVSVPFISAPLSPNQITILSNLTQICGIVGIAFGTQPIRLAGLMLFYAGDLLDFVDGNIARFRNQTSVTGVQLDQLGHVIVAPLFFASLGIAAFHDTYELLYAYLIVILAAGPAVVSYQLVALQQFVPLNSRPIRVDAVKSSSPLRHFIRKSISGLFHFKAEIVFGAILLDILPAVALLYAAYFPVRISMQGILDFRHIRCVNDETRT